MLGIGRSKNHKVLGLDISSTAVKLLELSHDNDGFRVDSYAVRPLPSQAVIEKNINDESGVSNAIKQVLHDAHTKTKKSAVAVAGSAVITKTIEMDAGLSDEEMESQIILEADQYIPYPLDEVAIDFTVEGPVPDNPKRVQVLLAACRKENVERREGVLKNAGLTPAIVDVEAYAIERAYALIEDQVLTAINNYQGNNTKPNKNSLQDLVIAIVDIGATMTTLNIIKNEKIIYTREQLFGGKQLTEAIQQKYDLSYEEAGLTKKQKGNQKLDGFDAEIIKDFVFTVEKQIARSLQFFYSSSAYDEIDAIVLAGGTACIKGLTECVEEELNVPTILADPFVSMSVAETVNAKVLHDDAPAMMIACGLAMRSFH